jgi:UDP-N-acetylmuramoylalanine--D-glutamate ligase
MDRYQTLDAYASAKARIFAHAGLAVINLDDPLVSHMPRAGQASVGFSVQGAAADYGLISNHGTTSFSHCGRALMPVQEMRLPGRHNAANALAALALGDAMGLPMEAMLQTLTVFAGLPHRSQMVAERGGVRFIDDSKGTNVGATIAAVSGLIEPLVVIAGGDGKGQDFSPLAAAFSGRVRHAVLIGRDRDQLASALAGICDITLADDMDAAVQYAFKFARPGDIVLLSPACASLDMFTDYADRGARFAAAAKGLLQ